MRRAILFFIFITSLMEAKKLHKNFVYIQDEIPNIQLDIRYYAEDNFIGSRIDGYLSPKAILTEQATKALKKVQDELNSFGLGLKVFDAYRPQKAVNHFVKWGVDLDATKMKESYYPTVDKKNLFRLGYIAKKSGHSRGSTVDLTIIELSSKTEIDMGSSFDFFGKESWVKYLDLKPQQRANRALLNSIMIRYGFKSYKQEWWHFTLKNEPYGYDYFDFDVL
jgi:D-alanyl-D-alanine dipeptidase